MPSRRSHEKSHHGCVTCKRRRVKVSLSNSDGPAASLADRNSVMKRGRHAQIVREERPNVSICQVMCLRLLRVRMALCRRQKMDRTRIWGKSSTLEHPRYCSSFFLGDIVWNYDAVPRGIT